MNRQAKQIVIINGSPKATSKSVSGALAAQAQGRFAAAGITASILRAYTSLKDGPCEEDLAKMRDADALLLVFPLYIFCIPAMLMRFMEDYAAFIERSGALSRPQNIYAIVNCGFPEPGINEEALCVTKSFARHIGAAFRFGVSIGSGGMITQASEAPFISKALDKLLQSLDLMAQDIFDNAPAPMENVSVSVGFPRRLYFLMGNFGWHGMARQNKLKRKDLYARPYQPV